MTSNIDLVKLAKHYKVNLNGVYMKDELVGLTPKLGNYIINLESTTANGGGTHWVAIVFTKNYAYYFDSFAGPAPTHVDTFIRKRNEEYKSNEKQVQSLNSIYCGWYCLALFHFIKFHFVTHFYETVHAFSDMFKENRDINNSIIRNYFRKLKKHPIAIDKLHI